MSKKATKVLSLVLCLLFVFTSLAACGNSDSGTKESETTKEQSQTTSQAATEAKPNVTVDTAADSSELPDWQGKQLKLRVWQGHGTGGATRVISSNDVVSPEIKRLFGIELDKENSFDNGGQDLPSKLAVLAASNDFPEIGYNVINEDIVKGDKIYDLTELLPKYAPHLWEISQKYGPRGTKKGYAGTGKQYSAGLLINNDAASMLTLYPDLDLKKYQYIAAPMDAQGWLAALNVRDDILKLAYPNAKSQADIEDLYMKNGQFTREEVYDIPIKSREEAIKFIYDIAKVIKDNNIKENGKPVHALPVFSGQDNWALMAWMNNLFRGALNFNYFTFFNPQTKKIELGYKQSWFKEDMLVYNKMVRDGVAPASSLIENNEIFMNKLNNGEYAISYAWLMPDNNKIVSANKPWRYRKVFLDIPQDTTKSYWASGEVGGVMSISIFKDKVKEEDLPQILQWLDFMATPVGMKLACWGPKTAGLWEEVDGKRKFTNKELEECLVYGVANGANEKYNLSSTITDRETVPAWPGMPVGVKAGGIYNPKYVYDMLTAERKPENANNFFASGIFGQPKMTKKAIITTADIWAFTNEVPAIKKFWDVRGTGFEPLMTKVLAAKSDEEFEKAYAKMIEFAEKNGLDDAALAAAEKLLQDKYPEDWAAYLEGSN